MERVLRLYLWLIVFGSGLAELKWQKTYWHYSENPGQGGYRRFQTVSQPLPKLINFKSKCECPPHDECKINFKLNEAALDLNKYRGIITEEDAKKVREANTGKPNHLPRRIRRFNDEVLDVDCCCPPREVMMPTIITEKKFNETLKRMKEDN